MPIAFLASPGLTVPPLLFTPPTDSHTEGLNLGFKWLEIIFNFAFFVYCIMFISSLIKFLDCV